MYIQLQQYLPLAVLKPILHFFHNFTIFDIALQQYLPLAVLKLKLLAHQFIYIALQQYLPLAVLKQYHIYRNVFIHVATVLTVYGIETLCIMFANAKDSFSLQQYLPLAVLKRLKSPTA